MINKKCQYCGRPLAGEICPAHGYVGKDIGAPTPSTLTDLRRRSEPIDLDRLPAYENYFVGADTLGAPSPVTNLSVSAGLNFVILSWTLPPEAAWRTWKVFEGVTSGFAAVTPILTTDQMVVSIPHASGSGPWYYKVRAVNARDESSTDVPVGPITVPLVTHEDIAALTIVAGNIAADTITTAKLNVADVQAGIVTAARVNALAISASSITTGTLDAARIGAGSITGDKIEAGTISTYQLYVADVQANIVTASAINALTLNAVTITGGTITGTTLQTASSGNRLAIGLTGYAQAIRFYDVAFASGVDPVASIACSGGGLQLGSNPYGGKVTLVGPVTVDGALNVTGGSISVAGSINSTNNYASKGTSDGIWIQESSAGNPGSRWKLTFNYGASLRLVIEDGNTAWMTVPLTQLY